MILSDSLPQGRCNEAPSLKPFLKSFTGSTYFDLKRTVTEVEESQCDTLLSF